MTIISAQVTIQKVLVLHQGHCYTFYMVSIITIWFFPLGTFALRCSTFNWYQRDVFFFNIAGTYPHALCFTLQIFENQFIISSNGDGVNEFISLSIIYANFHEIKLRVICLVILNFKIPGTVDVCLTCMYMCSDHLKRSTSDQRLYCQWKKKFV